MSQPWFENQLIAEVSSPAVVVVTDDDNSLRDDFRLNAKDRNLVVRKMRGSKMTSKRGLMDEFGAALQFFDGFGENWHALKECLGYVDEWLPGDGYVLLITNPELVLKDESPEEFKWFLVTIQENAAWWSEPVTDNGRFNRKAIPFRFVFKCADEVSRTKTESRLTDCIGSEGFETW